MIAILSRIQRGLGAAKIVRASLVVVTLVSSTQLHAAELRVISGGAAQQILQTPAPKFESSTGSKVELSFAVVGAIQQRLAAGEKADVVLFAGAAARRVGENRRVPLQLSNSHGSGRDRCGRA
jgi:ABC-type molybdate transport system substrate-binding protein